MVVVAAIVVVVVAAIVVVVVAAIVVVVVDRIVVVVVVIAWQYGLIASHVFEAQLHAVEL